jgi:hypothetical protein
VSALQIVGIYPSTGWHPSAPLSSAVVAEVADATRTAARARRLQQSTVSAEAAVLRVAGGLGVAGPPPVAVAEPPPPAPAPQIIVAPNIVVEAPPPATVIVRHVAPEPPRYLTRHYLSSFSYGVPFAPIQGPRIVGPIPERITPLSSPAGRLHGPLVQPLQSRGFTRPAGF